MRHFTGRLSAYLLCSEFGVWLISIPVGARPGCFFAGVRYVWSARVGGARRAPRGTAR